MEPAANDRPARRVCLAAPNHAARHRIPHLPKARISSGASVGSLCPAWRDGSRPIHGLWFYRRRLYADWPQLHRHRTGRWVLRNRPPPNRRGRKSLVRGGEVTRIGPTAAAATCKPCASKATQRARRAMCAVCTGGGHTCQRSGQPTELHIQGQPCPRGWHPDRRGIIRWHGAWSGVPGPLRLYLAWKVGSKRRKSAGSWRGFYRSFPGCGCNRRLKAAWKRLNRQIRRIVQIAARRIRTDANRGTG